jgi:hypothetical protein
MVEFLLYCAVYNLTVDVCGKASVWSYLGATEIKVPVMSDEWMNSGIAKSVHNINQI